MPKKSFIKTCILEKQNASRVSVDHDAANKPCRIATHDMFDKTKPFIHKTHIHSRTLNISWCSVSKPILNSESFQRRTFVLVSLRRKD